VAESFDAVLAGIAAECTSVANACERDGGSPLLLTYARKWAKAMDRLAAAHAAEAKDAARYRLARNAATPRNDIALCIAGRNGWEQLFGDDADAAIDAFLAEQALATKDNT
jgi:hypothetical protein